MPCPNNLSLTFNRVSTCLNPTAETKALNSAVDSTCACDFESKTI